MNQKTKIAVTGLGLVFAIFTVLYISGLSVYVPGLTSIYNTGNNPETETKPGSSLSSEINYPEADFSLQLLTAEGERITLEEMRGKVIFINIWATWCPPCILEMPDINELYKAADKEKVEFIMLSVDAKFEKAKDFHRKKGYQFEIYKTAGKLPPMYSTGSIPTTFVINAKGKLVLTHMGMGDFNTNEFKSFLKEQY